MNVWSNSKTKQVQTKEIHDTPDGQMYVVRSSTRVQQFLHWNDIFTLVLRLIIPVTADTDQNSGEYVLSLEWNLQETFPGQLSPHKSFASSPEKTWNHTYNSYVLSTSHLSSSQVRHLDTLEILDSRHSHNWPFLFLEENPLSHVNWPTGLDSSVGSDWKTIDVRPIYNIQFQPKLCKETNYLYHPSWHNLGSVRWQIPYYLLLRWD